KPSGRRTVSCPWKCARSVDQSQGGHALTAFQLGSIGTASRGICQGPRNNQVDLSFYKTFNLPVSHFPESLKLQFRIELFNAFNHAQFRAVDTGYNAGTIALDHPTLDAH